METTTDQREWVLLTDGEEVGPVRMGVTLTPDSGLLVLRQDEDEIHLTPAMVRRMLQLVDRAWN